MPEAGPLTPDPGVLADPWDDLGWDVDLDGRMVDRATDGTEVPVTVYEGVPGDPSD